MTRGHGWRFLTSAAASSGRLTLTALVRGAILAGPARRRRAGAAARDRRQLDDLPAPLLRAGQLAPVLDLLVADDTMPRALPSSSLPSSEHVDICRAIRGRRADARGAADRHAIATLRAADPMRPSARVPSARIEPLDGAARATRTTCAEVSDTITHYYFSHAVLACQLTRAVQLRRHARHRVRLQERSSVSHHVARLTPRVGRISNACTHDLQIDPAPAVLRAHQDYFGNPVAFFAMQGPHRDLDRPCPSSRSTCRPRALPSPADTPPWETVRDRDGAAARGARVSRSTRSIRGRARGLPAYAARVVPAGPAAARGRRRPDAPHPRGLQVRSGGDDRRDAARRGLPARRGVCQDFAHLEIACLRSLGLPARYVSGYLETVPPPARPRCRRRRLARLARALLSRTSAGLTSTRPTTCCRPRARHAGLGPRLRRRQPDPRRHPRRRRAHAAVSVDVLRT